MGSHGEHRCPMVRIGNGLAPAARDHYQLLPPARIIKYTHEANRLHRTLHHSHGRIVRHSEHPIQAILLDTVGRTSCCRPTRVWILIHGGAIIWITKAQKRQRSVSLVNKNPKDGVYSENAPCSTHRIRPDHIYSYAHTRTSSKARIQRRPEPFPTALSTRTGHMASVSHLFNHKDHSHRVGLSGHILIILITINAVHNCISISLA